MKILQQCFQARDEFVGLRLAQPQCRQQPARSMRPRAAREDVLARRRSRLAAAPKPNPRSSNPIIRPRPRTSCSRGAACANVRASRSVADPAGVLDQPLAPRSCPATAIAAAQARWLPPKVVPSIPLTGLELRRDEHAADREAVAHALGSRNQIGTDARRTGGRRNAPCGRTPTGSRRGSAPSPCARSPRRSARRNPVRRGSGCPPRPECLRRSQRRTRARRACARTAPMSFSGTNSTFGRGG